jgi:hypothetical protein
LQRIHHRGHRAHRGRLIENHSRDSIDKPNNVEIDDETDAAPAKPHVTQQLGFVYRQYDVDGFYFDNDEVRHPEIESVPGINRDSIVNQRQYDLNALSSMPGPKQE